MFTGLISAIGEVAGVTHGEDATDLVITAPYDGLMVGESIAVDGACLTVVDVSSWGFTVQVVRTSADRTVLGSMVPGTRVNLERALQVGDRLGGHIVQGHVDGVGTVVSVTTREDARLVDIAVPEEIQRITIPLGSITVNGVSMTVNAVPGSGLVQISLIPITLEKTTLGGLVTGDRVHLEGDVIAKYVERLLDPYRGQSGGDSPTNAPAPPAGGER